MFRKKIKSIFVLTIVIFFATSFITQAKIITKESEILIDNVDISSSPEIINNLIYKTNARWKAQENEISEQPSILRQAMLGCNEEENMGRQEKMINDETPPEFDWRNFNGIDWTTSIKNQGSCGSCVAFGSIGVLETLVQISVGEPFDCDLSEAHLFNCGGGMCSMGWTLRSAADYLKSSGVSDESCFPYNDYDMPCNYKDSNWKQRTVKISNHGFVASTVKSIKNALIEYGPLVTSMRVYTDFYYYNSGIYSHVSGSLEGYHAIAIVGYNDNEGYWICKNSWGTNWGENGWFKIEYGECGIEQSTMYYDGIYGNFPPFPPKNPNPNNGKTNLDGEITLSWNSGGDPDGHEIFYTVFFTDDYSIPLEDKHIISNKQSLNYIELDELEKSNWYKWKVVVEDSLGSKKEGPIWGFGTVESPPPTEPIISGPNNIQIYQDSTYSFSSEDLDGEFVYYYIKWGDGDYQNWIGPFESGKIITLEHQWQTTGKFTIEAKAKDIYDVESNWSSFQVNAVKTKSIKTILSNINENRIIIKILQNILKIA